METVGKVLFTAGVVTACIGRTAELPGVYVAGMALMLGGQAILIVCERTEPLIYRWFFLLGGLLNSVAFVANHQKMPFLGSGPTGDFFHVSMDVATPHLVYLCDIMRGASIGDLFILGSALTWLSSFIVRSNR